MGNTDRAVILAKIEAIYATDPTPAGANAILTTPPALTINGEKIERKPASPSLSPWAHLIGKRDVEISFDVELRGYGAAYTALLLPEISPLMRACGFDEAVDLTGGSETVTYAPVSTAYESCTIYFYDDGFLYKVVGCRGDVEFENAAGGPGIAKFKFGGLYAAPEDGALASPTYHTTVPPRFLAASFTLGGYAAIIDSLNLKMGNSLAKRASINAVNGISEIYISGRTPGGTLAHDAAALSAENPFTAWLAGTGKAIVATLGDTQYNQVQYSVPLAQYDSVSLAEREKTRTFELPFMAVRTTGDDELTLVFD